MPWDRPFDGIGESGYLMVTIMASLKEGLTMLWSQRVVSG